MKRLSKTYACVLFSLIGGLFPLCQNLLNSWWFVIVCSHAYSALSLWGPLQPLFFGVGFSHRLGLP
jgi:hypothetical protein